MLIHELFQEQLLRDRAQLLDSHRSFERTTRHGPGAVAAFRTLITASVHRVLRLPAPARPSGSGC